MGYEVVLTKRALKQLKQMDRKTMLLVTSFIEELDGCENPLSFPNVKKLQGVDDGWRWRVGTYRILGIVRDGELLVEVFKVGRRRDVYGNM